ncbi:MAG: hypothetical protein DMG18_08610, partial [Acidobacteria bacterium]
PCCCPLKTTPNSFRPSLIPPLDGTYTVFGRVAEGMDVVEKIAAVPVENERPKERVDIYAMKLERKK